MLHSVSAVSKYRIQARNGELGIVSDLAFDEDSWLIRYVVVDTRVRSGGKVFLPREALVRPAWSTTSLRVDLTLEDFGSSQGAEAHPPLAQGGAPGPYEGFSWMACSWGGFVGRASSQPRTPDEASKTTSRTEGLRSLREIQGGRMEASDGRIGDVADFLFSVTDWRIRYAVADAREWLPDTMMVVPLSSIARMDWSGKVAHLNLDKAELEIVPELQPAENLRADGPRRMTVQGLKELA